MPRLIDTGSFQWDTIKKHLQGRIEENKNRLVILNDPIMIHRTQGRICELKDIIEEMERHS